MGLCVGNRVPLSKGKANQVRRKSCWYECFYIEPSLVRHPTASWYLRYGNEISVGISDYVDL